MIRTTRPGRAGGLAALGLASIGLAGLTTAGSGTASASSAAASGAAASGAGTQETRVSNAAFERMKTLVGNWKGSDGDMKFEESFRLISGGTAIMEELKFPSMPEHDMVSVYHLDGGALMLTHYCAQNNQPRMRNAGYAGPARGKGSLSFDFVDVTNLAGPGAAHMHHVTYEFVDDDHYKSTWTSRKDGADQHSMEFNLERVH